jgi:tRNA-binding EMAP/Myf-like protein
MNKIFVFCPGDIDSGEVNSCVFFVGADKLMVSTLLTALKRNF